MSDIGKVKYLLVVVTRAYADLGASNDEFVHEWGYPREDDHAGKPTVRGEVALLLVHGHKNADPLKAAKSALPDIPALQDIRILHHSLDLAKHALDKAFGKRCKQCFVHDYHTEGTTAVSGLKQRLTEVLSGAELPDAIRSVDDTARGRPVFAERLYGLRAGLLRLRLSFETEQVIRERGEASEVCLPKNRDTFLATAKKYGMELREVVMGDSAATRRWSPVIKKAPVGSELWEALVCLNLLMPDDPKTEFMETIECKEQYQRALRAERAVRADNWGGWDGWDGHLSWASRARPLSHHAAIREDFARFARAVDVLIQAFDSVLSPAESPAETSAPASGRTSND